MYAELVTLVMFLADESPEAEDVKAGWPALLLLGLMILAVVVLGFSLVKRLRNVERAEAEGLYDPSTKKRRQPNPPVEPADPEEPPADR